MALQAPIPSAEELHAQIDYLEDAYPKLQDELRKLRARLLPDASTELLSELNKELRGIRSQIHAILERDDDISDEAEQKISEVTICDPVEAEPETEAEEPTDDIPETTSKVIEPGLPIAGDITQQWISKILTSCLAMKTTATLVGLMIEHGEVQLSLNATRGIRRAFFNNLEGVNFSLTPVGIRVTREPTDNADIFRFRVEKK